MEGRQAIIRMWLSPGGQWEAQWFWLRVPCPRVTVERGLGAGPSTGHGRTRHRLHLTRWGGGVGERGWGEGWGREEGGRGEGERGPGEG